MRTLVIAAGVVLIAAAGAHYLTGGWRQAPPQSAATPRQQAAPVEVSNARAEKSTIDIRAVGSLRSDESVQIAPEIAGRIAEIVFKEGQEVKQGDVLVKLDDTLARAEVSQARARHAFAKSNYDRLNVLARTGMVTERAREEATSNFQVAAATVELSLARLSKHVLQAPFPGVVGLRRASVGAFISVPTPIVNLEKIDVLKMDFKIPEIHLGEVSVGQSVGVIVDSLPERTFAGTIYAIDPLVDVNGRSLQIRARLANPERVLRPGLFARIVIKGKTERTVLTVPESAIMPRSGEAFVYQVQDGKAVETKVRLGMRKAGSVEVIEGLAPGAAVVVAGHQRLRNGAAVEVVPVDRPAGPQAG